MKKPAVERINYLAQLSQLSLQLAPESPSLGRLYGSTMSAVARKSVTRLDQQTKRRFCKKCMIPMVPARTASLRVVDKSRKQNRPTLRIECVCGHVRHFPMWNSQEKK